MSDTVGKTLRADYFTQLYALCLSPITHESVKSLAPPLSLKRRFRLFFVTLWVRVRGFVRRSLGLIALKSHDSPYQHTELFPLELAVALSAIASGKILPVEKELHLVVHRSFSKYNTTIECKSTKSETNRSFVDITIVCKHML